MNYEIASYYTKILEEELLLALGCTEPISIAYAAAKARDVLGTFPDNLIVECSGNIIKNVKGVIVPNSNKQRGVEIAAVLGIVGGDASKVLEVLTPVTGDDAERAKKLVDEGICNVKLLGSNSQLHIIVKVFKGVNNALVEIRDEHTKIVRIEKNGVVIFKQDSSASKKTSTDRSCLNIKDILDYVNSEYVFDAERVLVRQIECNTRIANEGLTHQYGVNAGKTLLDVYGEDDIKIRAKALAAAGSDARMSGCVYPVVINSGSGNQGLTVSLPVIAYAQELKVDSKTLIRALALSNLVAIHLKTGIGTLSAYCGAVSAACSSGAAITYMYGGDYETISKTITNTLATVSGMVCDGAKPSCATKIAAALDSAIFAHNLAMNGRTFGGGEGIVGETVEKTISIIGKLASKGMRITDKEILRIMVEN